MRFPQMATVRQHFPAVVEEDVPARVRSELRDAGIGQLVAEGARVAVSTGSRGIANIDIVVRTVVDCVKEAGGNPFILPAMGSHGGATAAGQIQVLAEYGITPESMGVEVESGFVPILVETAQAPIVTF